MLNIRMMLLVVLSIVFSIGANAAREWPEKVFHCQVITISGSQGLVSLQSYSLKQAEEGAIGQRAFTILGSSEDAASVVQCLEKSDAGAFTDRNFQAWFDGLDQ